MFHLRPEVILKCNHPWNAKALRQPSPHSVYLDIWLGIMLHGQNLTVDLHVHKGNSINLDSKMLLVSEALNVSLSPDVEV